MSSAQDHLTNGQDDVAKGNLVPSGQAEVATKGRSPRLKHLRLGTPLHHERDMRVICIGAGASGLCFAYKLQRSFEKFSLTVYEKNAEVSGTWYENKYPGCACDVPAHNYTYSWEPKLDWTAVYAGSAEINKYFNDFAVKNGLHKYCTVSHQVVGAHWDDKKGHWEVQITDLKTGDIVNDQCDILINAAGILNAWKWPDLPGLSEFKGKLIHSANWDNTVELEGKHVGLIGNGSSGIQILPAIQPKVASLTTFIRNPTWVSPVQGLEQHVYSEQEKDDFKNKSGLLLEYRKQNETALDTLIELFMANSQAQKDTRVLMTDQMKEKLGDEFLATKLIPQWGVGCRRLTPGINYLETLTAHNVKVVCGEIEVVTKRGCVCDDGNEYPLDVLICATGFDTSFRPRFPIVGLNGVDLREQWSKESLGYLGIAASNIPNYFVFLGPSCPIGNGPVISAIEAQADYMLMFCDRWQTENIHSFAPKQEAVDDFVEFTDDYMKKTVWDENCRSWYKNNSSSARVSALWPGSSLHYMEFMSYVRYDDWDVKYDGNRFAVLGNGLSQTEVDFSADWAYYIRDEDDGPFMSKGKQRKILTKSGSKSVKDGSGMAGNLIGVET
ncbi:hypothetical protein LTR66_003501 [Elasticomyces elasticus]|nr:hypothetical protein LTR66_003501 [Elasticomyces elasticus]